MEVKTIYIAKDGTEFEEESECLAYEESLTSECDFIQKNREITRHCFPLHI